VDRLVRQLGSTEFEEREEASRKLVEIGLPGLLQLRQSMEDPDAEIADRVKKCVAQIEWNEKPDFLVEELGYKSLDDFLRAAKDPRPRVRAAGVYYLFQFGDQGKVVAPVLLEALHDRHALVRRQAARTLGFFGAEKGVIPALIEALKDSDVVECRRELSVSAIASLSLGRIGRVGKGASAAVPALIDLANQGDDGLAAEGGPQYMAMCALGSIAAKDQTTIPDVVPALVAVLRGQEGEVRGLAAFALSLIGPKAENAVPALIDALRDKARADPLVAKKIRENALYALRRIGPGATAATPVLVAMLLDNKLDYSDRQGAAEVLGAIGHGAGEAERALAQAAERDEDHRVRSAAAQALDAVRKP
jgi:HEAT repeat protein